MAGLSRSMESAAGRRSRKRHHPRRRAAPVGNPRRCFAVAFYGGHEVGTDLDGDERALLASLARDAEIAYARVDRDMLQKRIEVLEGQLARQAAAR